MRLVLASGSPRRRELLSMAGFEVEARRPEVDESRLKTESIEAMLLRLAEAKAAAVGEAAVPIVAADTVVELDGDVLGKPRDAADATAMLRRLSGRRHRLLTGFAVLADGSVHREVVESWVTLRELSDASIDAYVGSGDPLDKAGSYGIQSLGAALVATVEGSYTNVVGLPLDEVVASLNG
ncbi:MAG: Maf family protein [Planctomycetota bacterium]